MLCDRFYRKKTDVQHGISILCKKGKKNYFASKINIYFASMKFDVEWSEGNNHTSKINLILALKH